MGSLRSYPGPKLAALATVSYPRNHKSLHIVITSSQLAFIDCLSTFDSKVSCGIFPLSSLWVESPVSYLLLIRYMLGNIT